jgi:hypothetical protein
MQLAQASAQHRQSLCRIVWPGIAEAEREQDRPARFSDRLR